ncbi:hypothetical protein [Pseudobutyrivibrio sp. MD2005]|uniref:hypothetical protein n=1 Tax=Pseudobutyrivibrio sp. MD2005 TaxID=1410616 RepID=UPI000486C870|nr:hypothetical protein [Pseudobutyrivibrio sp. MD2005]
MKKRNSITTDKKRLMFFVCMTIFIAVCIFVYSAFTGNENQVFTDVVNEITAGMGGNKSAEKNMFYIFSVLGIIVYSFYYLCFAQKNTFDVENTISINSDKYAIIALIVFNITSIIVYGEIKTISFTALMLALIVFVLNKELITDAISLYFILIYSLVGIYRIYVFVGGKNKANSTLLVLCSLFLTCLLVLWRRRSELVLGILFAQLFVPFTLLIYFQDTYLTADNSYITIASSKKIIITIGILILCFFAETIVKIIKYARKEISVRQILNYGTCVCIMAFNQYYGTNSLVGLDMHHSFEDVIGYSQIFEMGRVPYSQYIPVSGLYSVVQGVFFKVFGEGLVSYYNVSANIYYLVICLFLIYFLRKQLSSTWVLFVSLVFCFGQYNRVVLMTPVFLCLSMPRLIKNKNLWLKIWILTSFLHGLYYPVYGAAICLGFMPLGIWQIYSYIKTEQLKSDLKNARFWISWIITLLPVGLGIPLLLGTARHMLAMASQTIYADGATRFGQIIQNSFFPYINSIGIRLFLYYMASYLIVITLVILSVALFYVNGKVVYREKRLKIDNPVNGFLSLSISIIALISMSYSVVRFELESIYARSDGFVKLSFVALVIIVAKYMSDNNNKLAVFVFACFLIALVQEEGVNQLSADSKLEAYYKVPDGYIHANANDVVASLGECFVTEDIYDTIESSYEQSEKYDKDKAYLGIVGNFGEYYFDGFKGDSVLELWSTVKGYKATQETVDLIRKNKTIVGYSLDPVNNYYIYHYLVMSGEYIWNPGEYVFTPNDGSLSINDIFANNKMNIPALTDPDLGKTAGSWGSSMQSLNSIFSEPNVDEAVVEDGSSGKIIFDQAMLGEDADFLYVEFENMDQDYRYTLTSLSEEFFYDVPENSLVKYMMKKSYNPGMYVKIEWTDDNNNTNSMRCEMDEGKLLIPLGAGKGWLFDNHEEIRITVTIDDEIVDVPQIKDARMLKLRAVK